MSKLDHQSIHAAEMLKEIADRIPREYHLRIHACYHLIVPEQWGIHNRVNADYHLVYIKGGEGAYTVNHATIPFEKGKVILVSDGMLHSATQRLADPPHIIPVRFGVYANDASEPISVDRRPFSLSFVPNDGFAFRQLFEKLHGYYLLQDAHADALCGIILSEILFKCYSVLIDASRDREWDVRAEKVKKLIEEFPLMRFTSDQLAEEAELTEKYCRKMFKKQYGLTPMAYHNKVRMEHARFLLTESGQSVKDVAWSMGYPDPYAFSKQFKQATGYSPGQFKLRK